MKAIAVFTDTEGHTVPIDGEGQFMIYRKGDGGWQVQEVIPFNMDRSRGIGSVRRQLREVAEKLRCCSNIVAAKINGLPYTVLDPMGFELWEIEGVADQFLDEVVMEAEAAGAEAASESLLLPRKLGDDGTYYMDLKGAIKQMKGTKSSKEILIPILEKGDFYELKVLCDHIPPWFEKKFGSYGLTYEVSDRGQGEKTAIIRHSVCGE